MSVNYRPRQASRASFFPHALHSPVLRCWLECANCSPALQSAVVFLERLFDVVYAQVCFANPTLVVSVVAGLLNPVCELFAHTFKGLDQGLHIFAQERAFRPPH
jgi:hypothetical protein